MRKADSLLSQYSTADNIQLILLPEMSFTGYQFRDENDIRPFAEKLGNGPTYEWAKDTALRLNSGVCVGYPRYDELTRKMFNSILVVRPDGTVEVNYDKHFLYITDKAWAQPGTGFSTVFLDWIGVEVGLGICMDINPEEFEAPWTDYEFANFNKKNSSKLIIFSSAWCDRHPSDIGPSKAIDGLETINYWCNRLAPLLGDDVYILISDRVGKEPLSFYREGAIGQTVFCGSSCVISLKEPRLLGMLDTTEESALVVDIPVSSTP